MQFLSKTIAARHWTELPSSCNTLFELSWVDPRLCWGTEKFDISGGRPQKPGFREPHSARKEFLRTKYEV